MMQRGLSAMRRAAAAARPLWQQQTQMQARAASTRAAASAATPAASSSSKLLLGALLGGGSLFVVQQLMQDESRVSAAAAGADGNGNPAAAPAAPPAKVHVSDLASIDFRTIGIAPCPPLPEHAPRWLRQLARDPTFQYRDLSSLLDTSGHFLLDALQGERRLSEAYYFSEKVDEETSDAAGTDATAGAATHHAEHHPHLAPSLDFAPTTVKLDEPHSARTNTAAASKQPSAPVVAAASAPAPAAAAGTDGASTAPSAFSTFDGAAPPALTASGPEVRAVFHVGRALCGHRGIVHGGMTAALMDDVSGAATFCAAGGGHFTANLNINYLRPIRAGQYLLVRAQAVKQVGRKTYVNISVEDGRGAIFARGTALYVKPRMLPPSVLLAATQ